MNEVFLLTREHFVFISAKNFDILLNMIKKMMMTKQFGIFILTIAQQFGTQSF